MIQAGSPCDQGRARGLYDEQLQRQQQEKRLAKAGPPAAAMTNKSPRPTTSPKEKRQFLFKCHRDREQDDIDFESDL